MCSKRPRVGDEVFPPPVARQVPSEACPALLGTAQVGRCSLSACVLPAQPDGLHKAGNVSKRLWLMVLHSPLSLKPSRVEGWRWERAGRKLFLATCLHGPKCLGCLVMGMPAWYPRRTTQRKETPRSHVLQDREHLKPFESPKPF